MRPPLFCALIQAGEGRREPAGNVRDAYVPVFMSCP